MSTIRSRQPLPPQLGLTADEVAAAELIENWEREQWLEDDGVYIGDDGHLYYHENWVIQGKQA